MVTDDIWFLFGSLVLGDFYHLLCRQTKSKTRRMAHIRKDAAADVYIGRSLRRIARYADSTPQNQG